MDPKVKNPMFSAEKFKRRYQITLRDSMKVWRESTVILKCKFTEKE